MNNTKKSFKGKPTTNLLAANGGDTAIERASAVYGYYPVDITAQVLAQWASGTNDAMTISLEGKRDRADGGYPAAYVYFTDWTWAYAGGPTGYDWTPYSLSFTMPNPAGKNIYFNIYHMSAGLPGLSYSRNHQVEWSSFATPYTSGTRSTTNNLKDLINNYTITTTQGLTYNSDNTFSYNGTSNWITPNIADATLNAGSWTISAWVKFTTVNKGSDNMMFGHGSDAVNNGLHLAERSGYTYFGFYGNDLAGTRALSAGVWYNITFIYNYNSKAKTTYINGVLDATGGTVGYGGTGSNFIIGSFFGNYLYGNMPIAQVYNRLLSASEIQQNFNALRGRFGV